jgi:hypothetical protein
VSRRMGIFALWVAVIGTLGVGTSAQQDAQPQFKSGGLNVVVNRAVLNPSGPLVMSLVVTNPRDDNVEMFLVREPVAIADTGGMSEAGRVSGLPICARITLNNEGFEGCARGTYATTPTVIDGGNSITVTLYFPTREKSRVCSVDFSMLAGVRRTGSRSQEPWRQITIGLPNIKVC